MKLGRDDYAERRTRPYGGHHSDRHTRRDIEKMVFRCCGVPMPHVVQQNGSR